MTIKDYSSTAASNTAINGVSIAGTAPVSNMDDGLRQVMADISNWTDADEIASGSTTDLGSVAGMYVTVSGTATITSFGTLKAGMVKFVYFSGAGQITYNATSMILPGAANITRAAGDTAVFVSEGTGNWRCVHYQKSNFAPAIVTPWVRYTPTFTGFGTVNNVRIRSRRVGDSLQIAGIFTVGTPTAAEARMTLGFNGVDGGLTINSALVTNIQTCGVVTRNVDTTNQYYAVADASLGYINFALQSAGANSSTKALATSIVAAGNALNVLCEVPITEWA